MSQALGGTRFNFGRLYGTARVKFLGHPGRDGGLRSGTPRLAVGTPRPRARPTPDPSVPAPCASREPGCPPASAARSPASTSVGVRADRLDQGVGARNTHVRRWPFGDPGRRDPDDQAPSCSAASSATPSRRRGAEREALAWCPCYGPGPCVHCAPRESGYPCGKHRPHRGSLTRGVGVQRSSTR